MRILHIDPDDMDSPASGGGPIRTFEINRRLARRHEITVLTPSFPGAPREQVKEGVRYVRLGRRFGDHNSTYFISFYFIAPFAARRYPSDLLVEDLMPPTAATISPLLNRRKTVASAQWFFAKEWARQYKIPFHWYQPLGLKFYRRFVALTDDMRARLLSYNPAADVRVIPNGLNEEVFERPPSFEDFLLYLGRIDDDQKGVDLLVEAFASIASRTDVSLVMAGDGVGMEKTRARVRELGLGDRVRFEGKVGPDRKWDLLSRCRFLCVPSRYETFCMSALEAFAAAKPVVAFDIPHMDVVRPPWGIRVPRFDTRSYGEAVLTLLKDPARAAALGEEARVDARRYSWDAIARAQEEFYEEVFREN